MLLDYFFPPFVQLRNPVHLDQLVEVEAIKPGAVNVSETFTNRFLESD